ncbi:LIM/homeobox protein Lhx9 [Patella vulgata]|uniref:LIM/homeobox protein Lhx9 n=1 Tax=Patella vulgata TaxID=6465 RepID=UPI0021805E4B|nr:LIM/homeobox protein Lhx9 [Patella vulgata]
MVEKTAMPLSDNGMQGQGTCSDIIPLDCYARRPGMEVDDQPWMCAGCGMRICDRFYLMAVDKQWHVQCLKCSDCKLPLDSELTCFARDGNIYCKEDYYRRFGVKRCARCHLGIAANELVMRARDVVYHLSCFTCNSCNRPLTTGEQFGMKDHLVYCRTDYEMIFQGDYLSNMSLGLGGHHHSPTLPYYNGVGAVQKGRPRKRKSPCPEMDGCPQGMGLGPLDNGERPGEVLDRESYHSQGSRQKRVRTSFKHHQLRTMKSYFALNHNPDAKDLKQLAQKTGLNKRVLQVWFQNARAKYRRNVLKQDPDNKNGTAPGSPSDDKCTDSQSIDDMSKNQSPAVSDISSSPSLSDLHTPSLDADQNSNSISDIFSSSIGALN